jgi:hypothetical protein
VAAVDEGEAEVDVFLLVEDGAAEEEVATVETGHCGLCSAAGFSCGCLGMWYLRWPELYCS